MNPQKVDEALARELACKASVHPRTISKLLRGEDVRGLAGHRARAVLEAAGLLPASTEGAAQVSAVTEQVKP